MDGIELAIQETWTEIRQVNDKLGKVVELLEEIAEAFRVPEPMEETEHTCACAGISGSPVSNCPVCGGTGQA